jgi:small subunit ribosomal protein S27e
MTGEFIRVKCNECKNEQVIFDRPAGEVKCLVCGTPLVRHTGGKAEILGKVLKTVE